MWRVYLLRGYALVIGGALFLLGALAWFLPLSLNMGAPENVLHLGVGLIYFCGGWLIGEDLGLLRLFVGGMGLLLVLGKAALVVARWSDVGFLHLPLVGIVCLISGVIALLLALFVGATSRS